MEKKAASVAKNPSAPKVGKDPSRASALRSGEGLEPVETPLQTVANGAASTKRLENFKFLANNSPRVKHLVHLQSLANALIKEAPIATNSSQPGTIQRVVTLDEDAEDDDKPWKSDITGRHYATQKEGEVAEAKTRTHDKYKRKTKRTKTESATELPDEKFGKQKELRKMRRPTMYTRFSEFEDKDKHDQGPHTVAHVYTRENLGMHSSVEKLINKPKCSINDFVAAFKIIQSPLIVIDVCANIKNKIYEKGIDDAEEKCGLIDTITLEYYDLHSTLERMLQDPEYEEERNANDKNLRRYCYDLFRRLIDLNPMATYKWVTTDATDDEMKTKGEGRSTEFYSYIDSHWVLDEYTDTNHMNNFILTLYSDFDIEDYLEYIIGREEEEEVEVREAAEERLEKLDEGGDEMEMGE